MNYEKGTEATTKVPINVFILIHDFFFLKLLQNVIETSLVPFPYVYVLWHQQDAF